MFKVEYELPKLTKESHREKLDKLVSDSLSLYFKLLGYVDR